jgi:hypothetical protein
MSRVRFNGTTICLTPKLPSGWITRAVLELNGRVEFSEKVKWVELDQHVEADVAFDAMRGGVEIRPRPELHRVRGHGEIGGASNSRIVARAEVDRDPVEPREICRRIERVVQTANGQREAWRSLLP